MHATVRSLIRAASAAAEDVCILDTEASPEHLTRGTARYADSMYAVVEPYFKSLETGRRMAALAVDLGLDNVGLIANKIRDARDLAAVQQFAESNELDVVGVIPFDPMLASAEREGRAPFDVDPTSPSVMAIGELAERIAAA